MEGQPLGMHYDLDKDAVLDIRDVYDGNFMKDSKGRFFKEGEVHNFLMQCDENGKYEDKVLGKGIVDQIVIEEGKINLTFKEWTNLGKPRSLEVKITPN